MNYKLLGALAIICAPFLCIDFFVNGAQPVQSWTTGLFGFIYMIGWMCSIIALQSLMATGTGYFGKVILVIQLFLLSMAQVWNIAVILRVSQDSFWFRFFDPCWPFSNICMLIVGIAVIVAKVLHGWRGFVPLAVGLWLPLSGIVAFLFNSSVLPYTSGIYSAVAWTLLGIVVYTTKPAVNEEDGLTISKAELV